jgi:hypothetical protein
VLFCGPPGVLLCGALIGVGQWLDPAEAGR